MRKICVAVSLVLLALLLFPLAGCGKEAPRLAYAIEGEYFPEERLLRAEMTVSVPNRTENALSSLSFQLWANAYRENAVHPPVHELYAPAAYYDGPSYGGISVGAVEGGEGQLAGEDGVVLRVKLPEPLYPDETATLKIDFEVTLAKIAHRLGEGKCAVNLANFYPVLCAYGEKGFCEYVYTDLGDPFVSECADYSFVLTVPQEYSVACGGTAERTEQDGKAVYNISLGNARDLALVLGKDMKRASGEANGVEVEYCYFGDEDPSCALEAAKKSLAYFSRAFGDYAYPKYTVVRTDFPYGGMEYPALSMISRSLREEDLPAVIAHETAHQWWYAMVGSDQFGHSWQDEGLAEYSAALFLEAHPEYGSSYAAEVRRAESAYRAFFSVWSQVHGEADTVMDRPLTGFGTPYEYRSIAYDKGVILFDRVRTVLGDGRFFSGLRKYVSRYTFAIASPSDMISCFSGVGGNIGEVFSSFTEGRCVI